MEYLKNVVTLALDPNKCTGCGMCAVVCPRGVWHVANRKAIVKDRDACIECGACAKNCPVDAISVRAGVGCASGLIKSAISGKDQPCCGPPQQDSGGCCGHG